MASNPQSDWEDQESTNPAFSLLSILRTIRKRRTRIAIFWVLFALIGAVVVHFVPAVYQAEAVILVDTQKIPEKFVSSTVATDLDDRIEAIKQTLLSSDQLKKIIDEFSLYKDARKTHFDEEIFDMMRKDITITLEAVGGSSRDKHTADFRIGYEGSDPNLVMRVANRLADLYVEQNLKTRTGEAQGASEFLDTQLVEAKKQLDTLEATVSAYKLEHNGELPQQEQSLVSALSRLQTELEANRDAINRTQQTRVILDSNVNSLQATLAAEVQAWKQAQQPAAAPDTADAAPATPVGKERLTSEALEDQLAVARARYGDDYPDIVRLKSDIEKVKAVEAQRKSTQAPASPKGPQPAAAAVRSPQPPSIEPAEFQHTREQIAGLQAQIKGSDKELDDRKAEQTRILHDMDSYQHRIERLPIREQEMAQVTRDYEMAKANYKSLLDNKMAADMSLDMEKRQQSERFDIVDRAGVPDKPIKPNKPLLYAASGIVGLMLALVVGFVAELRTNVLLGEWELPAGTVVLARLPFIEVGARSGEAKSQPRGGWFRRKKDLVNATVTAVFLLGGVFIWLQSLTRRP